MSIFITGDTHGSTGNNGFLSRLSSKNFPVGKKLTKDDTVIILGDFGGVWNTNRISTAETAEEKFALDALQKKPFTTLFIPGNHENYDRLTGIKDEAILNSWLFEKMPDDEKEKFKAGYPRESRYNGFVRKIRENILMLEHGIFTIEGKTFFAYGGAPSHDISGGILNPADYPDEKSFKRMYQIMSRMTNMFRVKNISWWEQEQPDEEIERAALKALSDHNWKVDFVLTHTAGVPVSLQLGYHDDTPINQFLTTVYEKLNYKHWCFGHFHDNKDLPGGKDHLLYEKIIQIA